VQFVLRRGGKEMDCLSADRIRVVEGTLPLMPKCSTHGFATVCSGAEMTWSVCARSNGRERFALRWDIHEEYCEITWPRWRHRRNYCDTAPNCWSVHPTHCRHRPGSGRGARVTIPTRARVKCHLPVTYPSCVFLKTTPD